jgi:hypothetical protein
MGAKDLRSARDLSHGTMQSARDFGIAAWLLLFLGFLGFLGVSVGRFGRTRFIATVLAVLCLPLLLPFGAQLAQELPQFLHFGTKLLNFFAYTTHRALELFAELPDFRRTAPAGWRIALHDRRSRSLLHHPPRFLFELAGLIMQAGGVQVLDRDAQMLQAIRAAGRRAGAKFKLHPCHILFQLSGVGFQPPHVIFPAFRGRAFDGLPDLVQAIAHHPPAHLSRFTAFTAAGAGSYGSQIMHFLHETAQFLAQFVETCVGLVGCFTLIAQFRHLALGFRNALLQVAQPFHAFPDPFGDFPPPFVPALFSRSLPRSGLLVEYGTGLTTDLRLLLDTLWRRR